MNALKERKPSNKGIKSLKALNGETKSTDQIESVEEDK
jgi:hypothetical protein